VRGWTDGLSVRQRQYATRVGVLVAAVLAWQIADHVFASGLPLGVVILGLVFGSFYALTAIGLVLIYRANRVVNFAQAELGSVAAVIAIQLVLQYNLNYFLAMATGVVAAAILGAAVYLFIIRRFKNAPRLIVAVATIGIAQLLNGISIVTSLLFGQQPAGRTFTAPIHASFRIDPELFHSDHILAMIVVPAVMVALALFFRYTDFGIAIRAAAENGDRANLLGIPIHYLYIAVWAIAGVLSALAVMFRVSVLGFSSFTGVTGGGNSLLLRTLAAAVIARMENIPRAVIAALGLGVFDISAFWVTSNANISDALLVLVILVALLLQRGFFQRATETGIQTWKAIKEVRPIPAEMRNLPEVKFGVVGLRLVLLAFFLTIPLWTGPAQQGLISITFIYAIVAISLVILTGWAGHISLGQWALVGFGAAGTGILYGRHHWDFFASLLVGILLSSAVALVIGLPALRIRGPFLAVTTLAFAVTAGTYLLVQHYFPWFIQDNLNRPRLLGRLPLDAEWQMYYFVLFALALALGAAVNLRRSRTGRAMIAVRDNGLAAESVSINATRVNLTAFLIAGGLAGLAGGLYALQQRGVQSGAFDAQISIQLFSMVVIGGLGSLPGAILGAAYIRGAQYFLPGGWKLIASGAGILLLLMFLPEGLGGLLYDIRDGILRRVAHRRNLVVPSLLADMRIEREQAEVDLSGVLSTNGSRPVKQKIEA
jgi:branched-chain amino acid transport system permease protein